MHAAVCVFIWTACYSPCMSISSLKALTLIALSGVSACAWGTVGMGCISKDQHYGIGNIDISTGSEGCGGGIVGLSITTRRHPEQDGTWQITLAEIDYQKQSFLIRAQQSPRHRPTIHARRSDAVLVLDGARIKLSCDWAIG